ncbi:hypothetical protein GCM10027284_09470 [Cyclobacterium sediminis]
MNTKNQKKDTDVKKKGASVDEIVTSEQDKIENAPKSKASTKKSTPKKKTVDNAQNAAAVKKANATSIVIPYLAGKAKGEELLYAVRAWAKHFSEGNVVIIGDKPPWASNELQHIPHKPQSKNPQIDVAHKMIAAIASDKVSDVFIWTNDDIYTLCPVEIADIITLKAHGKLLKRGVANGIYAENCQNTVKALKKEGITDPFDYATHTPVVMEKSSLAKVVTHYSCDKEGHLIYSLYANSIFPDYRPIITKNDGSGSICASVYRGNPDPKILKRVIATRKWLNNNDAGWKAVEPQLKVLFSDKCRFEK